ncbi:MAG: sensor histidine kinase [Candidatus Limnocylindria bacterium]
MADSSVRVPGDARLVARVRWRLVAWSAGSTLVVLLLLGTALYGAVRASFDRTGTAQLEQRAQSLVNLVTHHPGENLPRRVGRPSRRGDSEFGRPVFGGPASGTVALVVDESGESIGPLPPGSADLPVRDGVQAALAGSRDVRLVRVNGTPARVLSEPVSVAGERYVIQILQDRTAEQRALTVLLVVLVVGGLAVLAAAGGVGFLYAGRALVPIRDSLRRQREFAADASHELRTPLTIVRGSVELIRKRLSKPSAGVGQALDDIEGEVDHLTDLVDDLLLLARSDSGEVQLRRERVDISDVTGEALQALGHLASSRHVALRLDAAPAEVEGDPDRLRQLVTILVDNAIRHSPHDGTVDVAVARNGAVIVSVEDHGAGIRPDDLPHVFDRFWRAADAPPGGTGLGLSIAAWIAASHGGSVSAANRDGAGARFEVRLPSRP